MSHGSCCSRKRHLDRAFTPGRQAERHHVSRNDLARAVVANQTAGGDDASFCMSSEYMALFDLQNDARPTGQPQLDYEPHTFKLHRDELGAPLLAAGVSPPPQHVSIPLHAL